MKVTIEIKHFIFWLVALVVRKRPSAPSNVTATVTGDNMSNVTVAWSAPALKPGQSTIKKFRVYAKADGGPSFGLIGETPDAATLSLVDENVAVGKWEYAVTTVDSKNRESGMSNSAFAEIVIEPDSVPPSPPTNVTATIS